MAFFPFRESADTSVCPQGVKPVSSPGNQLVGICLMTHIPDDLIFRRIEHIMERNGQFNNAQAGRKVSSGIGYSFNDFLTDFIGQAFKITNRKVFEVCRAIYIF